MDPSRLRQSFAALGISRGPPNRKSLISWLFSELTAIFRTKRTITPMTAMSVSTVCVLMSFFALHYVALFPCSENVLAVHPEAAALVRKWNLHAMRVADQYEHE